jgi:formate hydrogenlyase subunit 4
MDVPALSNLLLHLVLLLCLPPLLPGVINKTKACVAGRRGPPLLQLYFDLFKLARKEVVVSRVVTWVFAAAPAISLMALLTAGLLLPLGPLAAPFSFRGDWILFAYLLALGRFFTTMAALDTGSPFEGMGASREVTFACLSEPALVFAVLALAGMSGEAALDGLLRAPQGAGLPLHAASLALVAAGLFVYLLAENCRIPVDDPATHLELTMIHEAMVLDHSGPFLGLILYGASIKLFVLSALWLHLVFPFRSGSLPLDGALFVLGTLGVSVAIGLVESVMARLQLRNVPHLLVAASLLCGLGFVLWIR